MFWVILFLADSYFSCCLIMYIVTVFIVVDMQTAIGHDHSILMAHFQRWKQKGSKCYWIKQQIKLSHICHTIFTMINTWTPVWSFFAQLHVCLYWFELSAVESLCCTAPDWEQCNQRLMNTGESTGKHGLLYSHNV